MLFASQGGRRWSKKTHLQLIFDKERTFWMYVGRRLFHNHMFSIFTSKVQVRNQLWRFGTHLGILEAKASNVNPICLKWWDPVQGLP